jgi:hypothetical protein
MLAKVKVRQRDSQTADNSLAKRPKVPTKIRMNGINLIIFIFFIIIKNHLTNKTEICSPGWTMLEPVLVRFLLKFICVGKN